VLGQQGHYPFGEQWYPARPTNPATKWQFTSYERDGGTGESGNDYAMMRYHVNRLGRFASPDPLAGWVGDPQSLNQYAYTRNDSLNMVDPLGLEGRPDYESCPINNTWYPGPLCELLMGRFKIQLEGHDWGWFYAVLGSPRRGGDPGKRDAVNMQALGDCLFS
jgi:RHS repeat-associated protein